jgi:excisionase family DNA binding protein
MKASRERRTTQPRPRNGHRTPVSIEPAELTELGRYLTVTEAAAYLNTSERFIRRLVAERRVAFHRVGRHVRFATGDLASFVRAGRVEPITGTSVRRGVVA